MTKTKKESKRTTKKVLMKETVTEWTVKQKTKKRKNCDKRIQRKFVAFVLLPLKQDWHVWKSPDQICCAARHRKALNCEKVLT